MTKLYEQVCNDIIAQIQTGVLKVGDRLPPEAEYAATIGVSRATLRQAFAELEEAGFILRRQRAGTEIIATESRRRFSMVTSSISELLSLGRDTPLIISGTRTVPTEAVSVLRGQDSETGYWLEVSGTRTLQGNRQPFSVNQVYLPARFAAIEPLLGKTKSSVFQLVEETFGITVGRVHQQVSAIACPAEDARAIGLEPGKPALRIDARLYTADDVLVEVSVATFDPAQFQLESDVRIG